MKLIAKASISGPFGRREAGQELVVDADAGAELIERGLAEEAPALEKPKKPAKPTEAE